MTRSKNILAFLKTIILASLIIVIGYKILAFAGNYFIYDKSKVSTLSSESKDSYVFYSQSDSDITLFPWNYSANSITFNKYYEEDGAILFSDIIDTDMLYNSIRYYFYKMIPASQKDHIFQSEGSLSNLINYDNIKQNISVSTAEFDCFFYKGVITIGSFSYNLNFSFSSGGYIYSFQCQEIHSDEDYTNDIMTYANTCLSNLIYSDTSNDISSIESDILYLSGSLENYTLNITDFSDITLNFSQDWYDKYYSEEKYEDEGMSDNTYNKYRQSNNEINSENNLYQIIKAQNEYLIILSDSNIILHYDPLLRVFNGFNLLKI